ncbi:flagellar motor protein MotB, partial [Mesorhizobium sp.]|uniref:flagellar motor protein MotB n=1 Tax=Mesorhizobium sp. TaxID=1871066 RepID=UPI000FE831F7
MSVADADHGRHEIIIVRRSHDDHDEAHHGGVWKIAFADFMTAMMCFFLVMWLINAANEQTKAAVASYFNPVKLVDRNSSRKGLEDLGDGPRAMGLTADDPQEATSKAGQNGNAGAGASDRKQDKQEPQQAERSDDHLFADPYAVLSEIAADTGVMQNVSQKGDGGVQAAGPATGASGGASYRDPFEPDFWSQQVAAPGAEASAERTKIEGDPAKPGDKTAETKVLKVKAVPPVAATPL